MFNYKPNQNFWNYYLLFIYKNHNLNKLIKFYLRHKKYVNKNDLVY